MTVEDILSNYNRLGTAIIETIYTDDYLSIGGVNSTKELARLAEVESGNHVLDIGSGVGGPSIYLAGIVGCHVTGIDLVETNVCEANERAKGRGLSATVNFQVGDALNLPFEDSSFDVVWGQDAWCHVPDKAALIVEVTRVLRAGGKVAFTDWVENRPAEDASHIELLAAMAAPNLASVKDYRDLLGANDCSVVHVDDLSKKFLSQYKNIMLRLSEMESILSERFSPKIFHIVKERNACILEGFANGTLGGGRIVARKN